VAKMEILGRLFGTMLRMIAALTPFGAEEDLG
jgi:hypothetical protein